MNKDQAEIARLREIIKLAIHEGSFCQECAIARNILEPALASNLDPRSFGTRSTH